MTSSIKHDGQTRTFEMGDRVRLKKRLEEYVTTPISRKSVGVVADVQVSEVSGRAAYAVVFSKEGEAPTLWAHELVKIPKSTPKTEAVAALTTPPKMPDDVK